MEAIIYIVNGGEVTAIGGERGDGIGGGCNGTSSGTRETNRTVKATGGNGCAGRKIADNFEVIFDLPAGDTRKIAQGEDYNIKKVIWKKIISNDFTKSLSQNTITATRSTP